jgi:hypothetical protein
MALTKVDKDDYEVRGEYKFIQVRTKTSIMEDGSELSFKYSRRVLTPDADVSAESDELKALANALWTDDANKESIMAKKEKQNGPVLTFNDKEYDVNNDLNDEQKQIYLHLKNIDDKINQNNFIQQQLMVSKDGFVRMMEESLVKEEEAE